MLIVWFLHATSVDLNSLQHCVQTAVDVAPWRGNRPKNTGAVIVERPTLYEVESPWHSVRWQFWATKFSAVDLVAIAQMNAFDRFCQSVGHRFCEIGFENQVGASLEVKFRAGLAGLS
jgi:hypothetical protein